LIGRVVAAYRRAFAGLPPQVWLLAFVTLVNRSGTMVLPFLVLYLTKARGFSAAGAGGILGLYGLGALAGSYSGGWLADKVPPRRVLFLSLSLSGVAFIVLGFLRSPLSIGGAVLGLSVVAEAFRPAMATALVECSAPGQRARAFALSRLAVNLGMSVGPATGGFLALHSYFSLFVVDGATALLAAASLVLVFRGAGATTFPRSAAAAPERSPWADRPFLLLTLLMTLYGLVFFQLLGAFPLTLRDRFHLAENWIGVSLAVNTVVICLFEMLIVHSLRRANPYRVIGVGSLLMCLGFAILPLGHSRLYVLLTVLIWTIGEMLSLSIVAGVVADRAGEASQGRYMGIFSLSFSLAFVLAPLAGTWIYQSLGPEALWYGCGALGILLWGGFAALSSLVGRTPLSQVLATD